ncbi:uncharacterized protein BDW43DRAFT_300616 [Aspergillus alliaceus]|uniref:uncharacterized protein n=1 Tax=Petromyces alliaceus TaxID=209559 RepID=UPI0012A49BA8|nr:uncharacterized protein BDW43DRAFT_300616 [Aspergillus alliaceus]KAB8232844.1 hypothetical protein BDW43DRAFT_300616 [Aspergillus alliaceus]
MNYIIFPSISAYHVVSQGDNNKLRVLRSLFDGGVNFVHHVQRRGLVVMQSKNQCQTRQCLLTTGQVANVLPTLLRRHDGKQDTLRERIQGIDQFQLCVAAHRDHLVHLLQTERDNTKAFHEPIESCGSKAIETSLSAVAGCQGSIKICRTGFVEVYRGILRLLLQGCNSSFQRLLL